MNFKHKLQIALNETIPGYEHAEKPRRRYDDTVALSNSDKKRVKIQRDANNSNEAAQRVAHKELSNAQRKVANAYRVIKQAPHLDIIKMSDPELGDLSTSKNEVLNYILDGHDAINRAAIFLNLH